MRLLGEIDRKHEIGSLNAEDQIREVITRSAAALKKDYEDKKINSDTVIISEKTGEPKVKKEDNKANPDVESSKETSPEIDHKK